MRIVLTTGEITFAGTDGKHSSKLWFDFIKPDRGFINSTDFSKYLQKNKEDRIGDPLSPEGRIVIASYTVIKPLTLKFCNMHQTETHLPWVLKQIYIDLNEDSPIIKLSGRYGFGGFKGRGVIDYERSEIIHQALVNDYSYKVMSSNVIKQNNNKMKKRKTIL